MSDRWNDERNEPSESQCWLELKVDSFGKKYEMLRRPCDKVIGDLQNEVERLRLRWERVAVDDRKRVESMSDQEIRESLIADGIDPDEGVNRLRDTISETINLVEDRDHWKGRADRALASLNGRKEAEALHLGVPFKPYTWEDFDDAS